MSVFIKGFMVLRLVSSLGHRFSTMLARISTAGGLAAVETSGRRRSCRSASCHLIQLIVVLYHLQVYGRFRIRLLLHSLVFIVLFHLFSFKRFVF